MILVITRSATGMTATAMTPDSSLSGIDVDRLVRNTVTHSGSMRPLKMFCS